MLHHLLNPHAPTPSLLHSKAQADVHFSPFPPPLSFCSHFLMSVERITGPPSLFLLRLPASLCSDTLLCSPHMQPAVSWQTDEERDKHWIAEHPRHLMFTQAFKNRQMWTEKSRICLLTFSSLCISSSLSLSLSVCVPPDCSHTVSLALISPPPPPPSFFLLLLLWLLLSQTCCRRVSASSPLFLCLSQPLP